jgi:hypothetical protein
MGRCCEALHGPASGEQSASPSFVSSCHSVHTWVEEVPPPCAHASVALISRQTGLISLFEREDGMLHPSQRGNLVIWRFDHAEKPTAPV